MSEILSVPSVSRQSNGSNIAAADHFHDHFNPGFLLLAPTSYRQGQAVDATISVGDETNDVRIITIQLLQADGRDVASVQSVMVAVFADVGKLAFATTGGSTGLAISTDGALLAMVAKKLFLATCEADGDIDLTWTDNVAEEVAVGVLLPNGKVVMSEAFANVGP